MDKNEIFALLERTHRVPMPPLNAVMKLIFDLNTAWAMVAVSMGYVYPWGLSKAVVTTAPEIPSNRSSLLGPELE
jgi:hypothetical protein